MMSNVQEHFGLEAPRRAGVTFIIFAVTIFPILTGPSIMANPEWFRSITWPSFTPMSKFWAFAYLASHVLVAYQVAAERRVHGNRLFFQLWAATVLLTWGFVIVFFAMQSLFFAALSQLLLTIVYVALIPLSRGSTLTAVLTLLPAAVYCGFAALIIYLAT